MKTTDLEMIESNKFSKYIVFFYLVFSGSLTFPISLSIFLPLVIFIATVISYFFVSYMFVALYKNRPFFVLGLTFIFNLIGLLFRVILEWGEFSLMQELNAINVVTFLIFAPLVVLLFYTLIQHFLINQNDFRKEL